MLKTTIFCPNCGTANRDDSDLCSECGSVIPKLADVKSKSSGQPLPPPPPPPSIDFGVETDQSYNANRLPYTPPPPRAIEDFGIAVGSSPYDSLTPYPSSRSKMVCESCGMILRADDKHCPSCGKPIVVNTRSPSLSPQPYPSTPTGLGTYSSDVSPYAPANTGTMQPKPTGSLQSGAAKCVKCGAIVYDYETRCNNCSRILAPPRKEAKPQPPYPYPSGVPTGAATCKKCGATVYPHQTTCQKCNNPLEPIKAVIQEPYQRVSRCRRCGHLVYPTDSVCPNCDRALDSV